MTNEVADHLFCLNKEIEEEIIVLPNPKEAVTIEAFPIESEYKSEKFFIDINRKYLQLSRKTFQKRARTSIVLRRIDFKGGHLNPELSQLPMDLDPTILELMKKYERKKFTDETHLHIYIDGYGERWAFPIDEFSIISGTNLMEITREFLEYCNISPMPKIIQGDLLCFP